MIGELQEPYLKCAFRRVELCHRAVNFEKTVCVTSSASPRSPNDFQRDTEDEPLISIKQHGKGIVHAIEEQGHQLFISQQFEISKARLCSARPRMEFPDSLLTLPLES